MSCRCGQLKQCRSVFLAWIMNALPFSGAASRRYLGPGVARPGTGWGDFCSFAEGTRGSSDLKRDFLVDVNEYMPVTTSSRHGLDGNQGSCWILLPAEDLGIPIRRPADVCPASVVARMRHEDTHMQHAQKGLAISTFHKNSVENKHPRNDHSVQSTSMTTLSDTFSCGLVPKASITIRYLVR